MRDIIIRQQKTTSKSDTDFLNVSRALRRVADPDPHEFWKLYPGIRIRIKGKSWIRIRINVKIQKF